MSTAGLVRDLLRFGCLTTTTLFVACVSLMVYSCQSEGVGLCIPDEIRGTTTNSSGVTAELHLCGMSIGYFYYIELRPGKPFTKKIRLPEHVGNVVRHDPHIRWIGNQELEIVVPNGISLNDFKNPEHYGGVKMTLCMQGERRDRCAI